MILFHGTSATRATRIREFGFAHPDFEAELDLVAQKYDMRLNELHEQLAGLSRFVSFRGDDKGIYFSSHLLHAASYATRAPEFYWEALWAVYISRNPELGLNWNQSDEGHAWVLSQMQKDPPVVPHVEVPDDLLGPDAERIRQTMELMTTENESGGAEVGLKASAQLRVVDQTDCDYWIDGSLLRFLSDQSPQELVIQVEKGLWGEPFSYQFTKYWLWRDIKARLNSERLAELTLL